MTAPTLTPRNLPAELDDVAENELPPEAKAALHDSLLDKRIARIPEPTLEFIQATVDQGRTALANKHEKLAKRRDTRYQRTVTPPKVSLTLEHVDRIFSGTTNTELNRVVGHLNTNFPEVWVAAKDDDQQQFLNALIRQVEEDSLFGWIAPSLDSLCESGMLFWETYLMEGVGDIDDLEQAPDEDAKTYRKRVAPLFRELGRIIDVRVLDPMAVFWKPRDNRLHYVSIVELKDRIVVEEDYARGRRGEEDGSTPAAGDPGVPFFMHEGTAGSSTGQVETIRFYNDRWYAYVCEGKFVEGPYEHNFGEIPITMGVGIVTSSSNIGDKLQGHLEGLTPLEDAIDTQMTKDFDSGMTFGAPKLAAELPPQANPLTGENGQEREPIDLRNPHELLELEPGQKVVDIFQGWNLNANAPMQQRLAAFLARASMNDVAAGESPGADAAAFTVNALQTGALAQFDPFIHGIQSALQRWCTFIRGWYRRLGVAIYLDPMEAATGSAKGIIIKAEQWDNTRIRVTVSPLSDQQKLQVASALDQAVHTGTISEFTAARANPMVADPVEEALRKDLEAIHPDLRARVYQDILVQLGLAPPPMPAEVVAGGAPPEQGGTGGPAAMPPQQPPTVGAELSAASQQDHGPEHQPGPAPMGASEMRAGTRMGTGEPPR